MTLSEKKIDKIIAYWLKDIPIEAIATLLKISKNTVKKYLRERLGYSYLSYRNPSYISSQQSGAPSWDYSSGIDQQYGTPGSYGNPIDDAPVDQMPHNVFEQLLGVIEENKSQKQTIAQLTEQSQKPCPQCENLTQQLDKSKEKIGQQNEENENFKKQLTELTTDKDILKRANDSLKKTGEEKDQLIKDMALQHHGELEELKNQKNEEIAKIQQENTEIKQNFTDLKKAYDQPEQKVKGLEEKPTTDLSDYAFIGLFSIGAVALCYKKWLEFTSNVTVSPSVKARKNTGYKAVPNPQKRAIQPRIYGIGSGIYIPGTLSLGTNFGILIPKFLQKYIQQTR